VAARLGPACGLHRRLLDAVAGLESGRSGPADLAALVGAVLRREAARPQQLETASLVLPASGGWPSSAHYAAAGLTVARVGDRVRLEANPWQPSWLGADRHTPLEAIDACEPRRVAWPVPADPFFTAATGLKTYKSIGQRDAVRAVAVSGPSAAVVVSLPTGTGKTAVGLFRALMAGARGSAIVFVPTVSLARDQEAELRRAIREGQPGRTLCHEEFAYVSATSDMHRASIRDRIRDGTQGVVFTAPESVASLGPALREAARADLIAAFVIDEAHAVADWGSDFRPAFQMLAGLRRGLLDAVPSGGGFPTVLLTGTLTPDALSTTFTFIGASLLDESDEGPVRLVIEGGLRPEPDYWLGRCASESEREQRVVEVAYRVPRPAIIYVNRPAQARRLADVLRAQGFFRVAEYTGDTSDADRRRVERLWRDGEVEPTRYDLVVATSAFGLGINQRDVRAVIHARVPESVNRLYQEVGRGGRDGRASLALLLADPDGDLVDAERIAGQQLLNNRLEPRWHTMFAEKVPVEGHDSLFWVNVATIPFDHRGRRHRPNSKDRLWNMNALTLLQRAKLIRLHDPFGVQPPERGEWLGIEVLDPRIFTAEWRSEWQRVRSIASASRRAELRALRELVDGKRAIEEVLRDALTLQVPGNGVVRPNHTCGGCPACRSAGSPPRCEEPQSSLVEHNVSDHPFAATLRSRFGSRLLIVAYRRSESAEAARFVRAVLESGVGRLAVADGVEALGIGPELLVGRVVFLEPEIPEVAWETWRGSVELIVFRNGAGHLPGWLLREPTEAVRILVVPDDLPDPERPDRPLNEMRDAWPLSAVMPATSPWLS